MHARHRQRWKERRLAEEPSGRLEAAHPAKEDYSEHSLRWWAWKLRSDGEDIEAKPKGTKRPRRNRREALEVVELVADSRSARNSMTMRVGVVEEHVERKFDREPLGGVLDLLEARR